MKTNEEYKRYFYTLISIFSTWPVERLASMLALEFMDKEMHNDAEAELVPIKLRSVAAKKEADWAADQLLKLFDKQSDEVLDLRVAIRTAKARALSESAKNAAAAKDAKWAPVRDHAFQLATVRQYRSRMNAARSIAPAVIEFSKTQGVPMTPTEAPTTINKWLKARGYKPSSR